MLPYRLSPYIHFIESRLIPNNIQYGVFHQLTGVVFEPTERVRGLLLAANLGHPLSLSEEDLRSLGDEGRQIRELIEEEFLIPDGYDPLIPFLDQYVVRPIQNPAVAYRSKTGELMVVRKSMTDRVFSPRRDELPTIIKEKMKPVEGQVLQLANGSKTLRQIFRTIGIDSENTLEEIRQPVEYLTSPERQLIKFASQTEDPKDPLKPCNTVPGNFYHSSKWGQQTVEGISESIIDFHLHGIEDAWWELDLIEPTVNHSLRFPSEVLGGLDYGSRFCLSALAPEILRLRGNLDRLEVLEVGGGTGSFAKSFLEQTLRPGGTLLDGVKVNYHIMEISPALSRSQKELLSPFIPAVKHFQQDATEFDLPGHKFDLIIANEVVADFATASVLLKPSDKESGEGDECDCSRAQRWYGDGFEYVEKYDLPVEDAPDSFWVNAGVFQFLERAWKHLSPGGTLIISEYGSATKYPVQIYHLNHEEFSIHFGHVMACAQNLGFKCKLLTLKEFLEVNDGVSVLDGHEQHILILNQVLEEHGIKIPYAVLSKNEFEARVQRISEKIGLIGFSFSPLRSGFHYGPQIEEFMVLIMTKPK